MSESCCTQAVGALSLLEPKGGSRRRKLWELPQQCHCPVVGVCFALDALRKLVHKALGCKAVVADDYEVHVGACADCMHRNRLSELLQSDLEKRFAPEIRAFRAAKTPREVADLWGAAIRKGDIAGAFWAALTHPRCDDVLQEVLCRDMHMLQHQAGATVRMDMAKFNALAHENGVLARELAKVQQRTSRMLAEKHAEIEQLQAQCITLRAQVVAKDSHIHFLTEDMAALQTSLQGSDNAQRLQKKVAQLQSRQADLEQHNAALRRQLRALDRVPPVQAAPAVPVPSIEPVAPNYPVFALHLEQKTVLCVGGRTGNLAHYREVVERVGAKFAHHDGGLEDNQSALDASLAAADLVICQTGCISHNAYWRVKDFCKRTGKRCVFVESSSASALARTLGLSC